MTWNSGPCRDEVAVDRALFTRVAESCPGVVRTLGVLIGELDEGQLTLDNETKRALGDRIRRIGDKLMNNADRIVIDPHDDYST